MKFGILSSNIGSYSEPRTAVRVAQAAERAGWDAYLIWDHLAFVWDKPAADPWVTLGAVAVSTRADPDRDGRHAGRAPSAAGGRARAGDARPARSRPRRSSARVSVAATASSSASARTRTRTRGPSARRGARRDPALLSGERVDHQGAHFTVDGVTLAPAPGARIPIWIGGISTKARARAGRFDGWFADTASPSAMTTTPGDLAGLLEGYSFGDVAVMGYSEPGNGELHARTPRQARPGGSSRSTTAGRPRRRPRAGRGARSLSVCSPESFRERGRVASFVDGRLVVESSLDPGIGDSVSSTASA